MEGSPQVLAAILCAPQQPRPTCTLEHATDSSSGAPYVHLGPAFRKLPQKPMCVLLSETDCSATHCHPVCCCWCVTSSCGALGST